MLRPVTTAADFETPTAKSGFMIRRRRSAGNGVVRFHGHVTARARTTNPQPNPETRNSNTMVSNFMVEVSTQGATGTAYHGLMRPGRRRNGVNGGRCRFGCWPGRG